MKKITLSFIVISALLFISCREELVETEIEISNDRQFHGGYKSADITFGGGVTTKINYDADLESTHAIEDFALYVRQDEEDNFMLVETNNYGYSPLELIETGNNLSGCYEVLMNVSSSGHIESLPPADAFDINMTVDICL